MPEQLTITPTDIAIWRDTHYHRLPELAVSDEAAAGRFVDEVGFCLLFPVKGMELPTLWEAINGRRRPLPRHHFDRALGLTWDFKDSLPAEKRVYYGKLLRQKPTLVSLSLLPYFYALSDNCGDLDEYLEAYADGKMSEPAKRVYEALLEHGASPTSLLRHSAGLGGKDSAARFDRAITELQASLRIVKTGISDANRWKYCYVYDALPRWLPEVVQRATEIKAREALRILITRYLELTLVATAAQIVATFGWDTRLVSTAVDRLIEDGAVRSIDTVDGNASRLILTSSLVVR
jgi:hypothetical protein